MTAITPQELRSEFVQDNLNHITGAAIGVRRPATGQDLPPTTGNAAVDAAAARLRDLESQLRTARQEMRDLEAARTKTAKADRDALADAILRGEKDPGDRITKEHAARLAETTRRAAALKTAVERQGAEVGTLLANEAGEMAERLAAVAGEARAAERAALAELRAAAESAAEASAKARWAERVQAGQIPLYNARSQRALGTSQLAQGNGSGYTVAALLDAVEATLADAAG